MKNKEYITISIRSDKIEKLIGTTVGESYLLDFIIRNNLSIIDKGWTLDIVSLYKTSLYVISEAFNRLYKKKILLPTKSTNRFKINKDYFTINNDKNNKLNIVLLQILKMNVKINLK